MEKATVVPTPATWLPEDDILLKSAIEEGASLEALTKGAVPFSRKFTLQEVHDRWYALLYDAEVSAQACAHLFLDESDKPREIKEKHRKRKVGTLRKRYHERIKRIRNEYFGSSDLGFLTEPNLHSCTANRGDFHGQGILHDVPQVGDSVLRGCMTDPFGLQVTNSAMFHQAFPQVLTDLAAKNVVSHAADTFHSEGPNLLVSNRMSGTAKNDCLHGFPVADLPFPVQGSLKIDGMPPFQSSINARNDIPHSLHDNYIDTGKCLQPGGEVSNNSIYAMGFSPPLPSMTLWKTMEDIAAPDMPVNVVPGDKTRKAQDVSELPGNGGSKSKRADKQNGDNFINSASISGSDFADLPDSLFDFSTDDMLTMDVNRKDAASKSSCDNTPSSVPMGMDDIDTLKVGEKAKFVARAAIATELEVATSHSPTVLAEVKPVSNIKVEMSSEPEVVTSYASPVLAELKTVPNIKVEKSSESTLNNKPIEPSQNFLYCALNTEDTEIPCNDDIFLLIHPDAPNTSATISITKSDMDPASAKERNCVQGLNSVEKNEELAQSSKSSLMFGSYMLSEMVQVHTGSGITIKAELDDSCKDLAPRHKAVADPTQCKPTQTSLASVAGGNLDKDGKKVDSGAIETPSILGGLPMQIEAVGVNKILPGPEENPLLSDQEGSESENEDLHFSDIEAMILDMDLAPYDDDFYFSRKVSKYQQLNSKTAIMRMEQCARASLQRAMTFQGAIAILYSRRSKHFIRKPEVMLGRSTEETVVDIDLGKEERNNKISRRQAIIKMEHDGSFTLKNLAKNPMFVNGFKVGSGQLIVLSSSCLIEIRGISFVFESNQKYVKSFRQKISIRNQGQMASFKLVPKQEGS